MQHNNPYAGYVPERYVPEGYVPTPTPMPGTTPSQMPAPQPANQVPPPTQQLGYSRQEPPQYPWWRMLLWSVLGTIIICALCFLPIVAFGGFLSFNGVLTAIVLAMCVFSLGAIALQLLIARLHKVPLAALGIHKPTARMWHLAWQIPAYFMGLMLLNIILAGFVRQSGGDPKEISNAESIPQLIGVNAPLAIITVLSTAVLTPIFEELLFRGYLMGALRTKLAVPWVVVLSGVVFGLIHLHPLALVSLIYAGIVFGCLRVFHGNIWASMLLHACQNGLVCVVALFALYGLM